MASVLFDLDGTLTDSSEGITKCAQLALSHYGIHVEDRDDLRFFIGPPLRESFPKMGIPESEVEEAVRIFRKRYLVEGKFENAPYPGIGTALETLKQEGYDLYVATSKPQTTAVEILTKFGLAPYFTYICGAEMDGVRDKKEEVVGYVLSLLPEGEKPLMVGDTVFDVEGAKTMGVPCVCVSWGFGEKQEMLSAGAVGMVDTMEELLDFIRDHFG